MLGEVRVTFLGTGSTGDPRRRCGATLVTLADGSHVLVDTGGGNETLIALNATRVDLTRIRAIVLTHQHLDHAAGLPFVLFSLAMATVRGQSVGTVDVCAPAPAIDGVRAMCDTLFPGLQNPWWLADRVRWHGCAPSDYLWRLELYADGTSEVVADVASRAGQGLADGVVAAIETMAVSHGAPPVPAQSVRIDTRRADGSACRVVISGDTGPNVNMMRFATEADLLVHEAVEAEALGAHPIFVLGGGHATAAMAGRVAAMARAKRLALHHLNVETGQRPEVVRDEARAHFTGEVDVPEDMDVLIV
jgi:ribonuclease BN (tRNA processing enzyme)